MSSLLSSLFCLLPRWVTPVTPSLADLQISQYYSAENQIKRWNFNLVIWHHLKGLLTSFDSTNRSRFKRRGKEPLYKRRCNTLQIQLSNTKKYLSYKANMLEILFFVTFMRFSNYFFTTKKQRLLSDFNPTRGFFLGGSD